VIAGHGSPWPFLRKGSRDQLFEATGTRKLPTLKLPEGRVISHSRAILAWVREQREQANASKQVAALIGFTRARIPDRPGRRQTRSIRLPCCAEISSDQPLLSRAKPSLRRIELMN
jgi:glutathione S-transferase